MSDRVDTELALGALRMAGTTRVLEANWIHHTDRDCRYGSDATSLRTTNLARDRA